VLNIEGFGGLGRRVARDGNGEMEFFPLDNFPLVSNDDDDDDDDDASRIRSGIISNGIIFLSVKNAGCKFKTEIFFQVPQEIFSAWLCNINADDLFL